VPVGETFNATDELAADVHACIKRHGDNFGSDEQLEEWLAEDGISWSGYQLRDAVEQLEVAGWLHRPLRERQVGSPLPASW
jgi:hypothetical protein